MAIGSASNSFSSANSSGARESEASCWRLRRQSPESAAANMPLWTPFLFRRPHFTRITDTGRFLRSKNIRTPANGTITQKNYYNFKAYGSKWENGLSVPDSDMLITLADKLDTSVSVLLGETVMEPMTDDLKAISEKLEVINLQWAKRNKVKVQTIRWILIALCAFIVLVFIALVVMRSSYLGGIIIIQSLQLQEQYYMDLNLPL